MAESKDFRLPDPPWPEHTKAIDIMLAFTHQRAEAVRTRRMVPPSYGTSKLTPQERNFIRNSDLSVAELARMFQVSTQNIYKLKKAMRPVKKKGKR